MPYDTTQVSVEFSVAWIKENPELFASKYRDFFDSYWPKYSISSKVTKGFITLIAKEAA